MTEGLRWNESPIDLPDEASDTVTARRPGVGWACGVIAVSAVALLVFNSHALANWASQQPVTERTGPVLAAADDWNKRAGELGLNRVVDYTKQVAASLRKLRWDREEGSGQPKSVG